MEAGPSPKGSNCEATLSLLSSKALSLGEQVTELLPKMENFSRCKYRHRRRVGHARNR